MSGSEVVPCTKCGSWVAATATNCPECGTTCGPTGRISSPATRAAARSGSAAPQPSTHSSAGSPRFEYKVLTQKDKWFSGKFDPDRLEAALNAYAQQGWRVVSSATASFPGFFSGNRDELIVLLERERG